MNEKIKESWEHIKDLVSDEYPKSFYEDDFKIIDSALEDYEKLKEKTK